MTCECKVRSRLRRLQGRKPMQPSSGQCVCDCHFVEQWPAQDATPLPVLAEDVQLHLLDNSSVELNIKQVDR